MEYCNAWQIFMVAHMRADYPFSGPDIANVAFDILNSPEFQGQSVLLSKLGALLSNRFDQPWRVVLAGRSLRKLIDDELRGRIAFDGEGPQTAVRLAQEGTTAIKPRFEKTAWAAFAKPIADGLRRRFRCSAPFAFHDEPDEAATAEEGWLEIEPHLIPDANIPKHTRDQLISNNIRQWATDHMININSLVAPATQQAIMPAPRTTSTLKNRGLIAIEALIDAIPIAERSKYSLPLDLIHRLLSLH